MSLSIFTPSQSKSIAVKRALGFLYENLYQSLFLHDRVILEALKAGRLGGGCLLAGWLVGWFLGEEVVLVCCLID